MSVLDLYDRSQSAGPQPNEGARLPSGFDENFNAAWSDGRLFGQSIARQNACADVLGDYLDDIRAKTGNDLRSADIQGEGGSVDGMFAMANDRVAKMKDSYPDLDLAPLTDDQIDQRALAKAQAAHRTYEDLQAGEKGPGGSIGSFLGGAANSATDPINIVGLAIAPETGGVGILSAALRWGALAGVSQAAIEGTSYGFKQEVDPSYGPGQAAGNVEGAVVGGAVLGGSFKALGNLWTRAKTGAWPTSIRDAGNVIESEANVANTNIFPGVEGEVAHREALVKTIDDVLAERPVDVSAQITPELQQAARDATKSPTVEPSTAMPTRQMDLPLEGEILPSKLVEDEIRETMADAYMDMMPGQSALDVAIDSVKGHIADGMEKSPEGAPWRDVLSELQKRKRSGKDATINEAGDLIPMSQPPLQTPAEMDKTLTAPDHQDAIRADIDRERAMGDFKVPGIDEQGNHTMVGVDAAMDQVDAYKAAAEHIQACANPVAEAAE